MLEIFAKRYDSLLQLLNGIADVDESDIKQIEKAIDAVESEIKELKQFTDIHPFSDVQQEIEYYKNTLPYFQSLFIYYACIFSIKRATYLGKEEMKEMYLRKELRRIQDFMQEHITFITYYQLGKTYQDILLFTKQYDVEQRWQLLDIFAYGVDQSYYTRHSLLLSTIMAYERLQNYLEQELTPEAKAGFNKATVKDEDMTWQGSITALAELIIALYASGVFNNPKLPLAKVSRYICRMFGIAPINIHKAKEELRMRKKSRTPFLDGARLSLLRFWDEEDLHAL